MGSTHRGAKRRRAWKTRHKSDHLQLQTEERSEIEHRRITRSGAPTLEFAGPLAGVLQAGATATLAAEVGLVMGYVSTRVLGQHDVSLLGGDAAPRLLFVAPNLRKAVRELDVDPGAFHRWICAHELTHVFQFQGVPWLRDHLSAMLREYLASVEARIERGAAGGFPSLPNPARLVEAFRQGGLAALVQTTEQRALMERVQATMAVVEGYSEHVMDAIGELAIPGREALRAAMDRRRRSRSAPELVIERLLGFDIKLCQYEQGKRFCDAVVSAAWHRGARPGLVSACFAAQPA